MIEQILVGSFMMIVTVVIEAMVISFAVKGLTRFGGRLNHLGPTLRLTLSLSLLTLWLVAGISFVMWMWAGLFLVLGEFTNLVDALYFAMVSATTLGYGDVLLSDQWKLLSGFVAANGLILFSLNTAFLFEALRRIDAGRAR